MESRDSKLIADGRAWRIDARGPTLAKIEHEIQNQRNNSSDFLIRG